MSMRDPHADARAEFALAATFGWQDVSALITPPLLRKTVDALLAQIDYLEVIFAAGPPTASPARLAAARMGYSELRTLLTEARAAAGSLASFKLVDVALRATDQYADAIAERCFGPPPPS